MAIYLDNSASAPVVPEVWAAMQPFLGGDRPGNPASSHAFGRRARQALEDARERVASLLDAQPDEVLFTSGATEANNLAIFGLVEPAPGAIVVSSVEHPCVLEPVRLLATRGYSQLALPVTTAGSVNLTHAEFPAETRLVSVMLANHETGAVQPVATLVQRLGGRAPFHCDAAAAAGKMPVSFRKLGVSALTVSGHKFHGPQGVGALLVKRQAKLRPQLWGGHQQQGRRPGTEPVALAVGLATALEWCERHREAHRAKVLALRQRFLDCLHRHAAPLVLNGPADDGIPHTMNISFPGCPADVLLMKLDLAGVACSTGSACSSGSLLPSPVLLAMGLETARLHSAMRFSLSSLLDEKDVSEACVHISKFINELRLENSGRISPECEPVFFNATH
jgi:cysteine desulfurase